MTFNSFAYYPFLISIFLIYNIIGNKFRWIVLLSASFIFYASLEAPHLLGVLFSVILLNYAAGIYLKDCTGSSLRKVIFWGGVGSNILILAASKYLPLLKLQIVGDIMPKINIPGAFVAIGISYFVFQAISYLIDIYLGISEPERHIGYFALYIAFFPKLLQGPIERASDLLPQLRQNCTFDYNNIRFGMLMILFGLFKKIVVADRLSSYVNVVYNDVHSYSGGSLLLATYCYAIQIYCDFSGYTDIALGTARLFNIQLTQNFNSPYVATSIADFWRRWHISFSRWILDYIFKPLQMQWRYWGTFGTALALVVTFLISGVWHGAAWGFIVWGGLHAVYFVVSIYSSPLRKKIRKGLMLEKTKVLKVCQVVMTFNLVCFAWIFFRANNINDAFFIVKNMTKWSFDVSSVILSQGAMELTISIVSIALFMMMGNTSNLIEKITKLPVLVRWNIYSVAVILLLLFGKYKSTAFVYTAF